MHVVELEVTPGEETRLLNDFAVAVPAGDRGPAGVRLRADIAAA